MTDVNNVNMETIGGNNAKMIPAIPQQIFENPVGNPTVTLLQIDMAEVLKAHAESMITALKTGYNYGAATKSSGQYKGNTNAGTRFVGIYDKTAYGVYSDMEKLQESMRYWNAETVVQEVFSTYDEAYRFARNGMAKLSGIVEGNIPEMLHGINWRQSVRPAIKSQDEI